jgi:hypothetical protein
MKKTILLFVISVFLSHFSKAQFKIEDLKEWDKVKTDTTYVLLDSLSSHKNDSVKIFFNTYWKISTIKFIDATSYRNYLSPNATFLSLVYGLNRRALPSNPTMGRGPVSTTVVTIELSLQLWNCRDKYFKKDKKWSLKYINALVKMDIFLPSIQDNIGMGLAFQQGDFSSAPQVSADASTFKDEDGLVLGVAQNLGEYMCWGKGALKNYVQILNNLITIHKKNIPVVTGINVKNLKTDTLYVPDFIKKRVRYRANLAGQPKEVKSKDLFEEYTLNHTTISISNLNKKILAAKKDFYYLIDIGRPMNIQESYKKSESTVYVINGLTGEVVYIEEISDMNSSVMKHIYKEVVKN